MPEQGIARARLPIAKIRETANFVSRCMGGELFNIKLFLKAMFDADYEIKAVNNLEKKFGIQGFYHREGPLVTICYDSSLWPGRRRFTIAHEIGHRFLHDPSTEYGENVIIQCALNAKQSVEQPIKRFAIIEREADMFAAEILMPYDQLCEEVSRMKITVDSIEDESKVRILAKKFNVSKQAMSIRMKEFASEYIEGYTRNSLGTASATNALQNAFH